MKITEFKPSTSFVPTTPITAPPAMKVPVAGFKTAAPAFVPTSNPFKPTGNVNAMNLSANTFVPPGAKPAPVMPVKPVDPPKEKTVLLLERIQKGSETDVKSD